MRGKLGESGMEVKGGGELIKNRHSLLLLQITTVNLIGEISCNNQEATLVFMPAFLFPSPPLVSLPSNLSPLLFCIYLP